MQCPNCGKEAINVNGKFVCLDCGVEINPAGSAPVVPVPQAPLADPSIENHAEPEISQVTPPVEPSLPPQTEIQSPEPVKDDFLNDLQKTDSENKDGYNFTEPVQEAPVSPPPQETYFQPESVDITPKPEVPSSPAPESQDGVNFDAMSTPSGIGMGEPLVEDLAAKPAETAPVEELFAGETQPQESPVLSENPVSVEEPAAQPADLDDLLNQYSAPQAPPPSAAPNYSGAAPAFDSVQPANNGPQTLQGGPTGQIPGTANIPSADSVFGPRPENNSGQLNIPQNTGNSKKKLIMIIASAVVGILILFGLVFLGASLLKPKNTKTAEQVQQEETFKISEEVSKVMDLPLVATATFEHSVDFSDVTVPAVEEGEIKNKEALDELFKKPITLKGTWKTDDTRNIELSGTFAGVAVKKTYIAADNSTYVFDTASNAWVKKTGDTITEVPDFYTPEIKAALFYNTKVNSIHEEGEEIIDGGSYRRMKIVPKTDIVKSVLTSASPLLSKNNYSEVNLDNLSVLAWVTKDNQIYKITVVGDVDVKSDFYEGKVKVNSSITYEYNAVEIVKP